jgi:hypothetical protein
MNKTIATLIILAALLGVAIVPTVIAAPNAAPTNPGTTNLISWWALDETSGTRADSHGSNSLSSNNSVGYYATGIKGNAADFVRSNNQYLSHSDNADLSTDDIDFTVGLWVNLKSKEDYYNLLNKFGVNNAYQIYYSALDDRFHFWVSDATTHYGNVVSSNLGSPAINTWYFITVWHSASGDTINISVNNGTPDSLSYGYGSHDNNGAFTIGGSGSSSMTDAYIDEAYFYKRNLSADERAWLYNSGSGRSYCEVAENCATSTPTITQTSTITQTATVTQTTNPTFTPTVTSTATATPAKSNTPTVTATAGGFTSTPTLTSTVTGTATVTATTTITATPTITITPGGPTLTPNVPTPYFDNRITYGELLNSTLLISLLCILSIMGVIYIAFTMLIRKK